MSVKIHNGNCLDVMPTMEANSIDAIITDPPYGLKFMGKDWDFGVPGKRFWVEALRVAKPGAMLLAFGGTRTHHRLICAIEDAGWIIRDVIMWVYGSGFPKSHNISKAIDKASGAEREVTGKRMSAYASHSVESGAGFRPGEECKIEVPLTGSPATLAAQLWDGWGTALKPAYEPIVLAMKPLDGTFANNALTWGVAGLWIDGGRVGTDDTLVHGGQLRTNSGDSREGKALGMFQDGTPNTYTQHAQGRWPANLIHDGSDEVVGLFPQTKSGKLQPHHKRGEQVNCYGKSNKAPPSQNFGGDSGSAARFFYCAKASKRERNAGLEGAEGHKQGNRPNSPDPTGKFPDHDHRKTGGNNHPTVKPIALMRYLCRLSRMPTGGAVLDPFMGSGSTGCAAVSEERDFIGIELDTHDCNIAQQRIAYWENEHRNKLPLFSEIQT